MKKMLLFSLVALLFVTLGFGLAGPAAARAAKTTTCAQETKVSEIPGETWFSDDGAILHIRGMTSYDRNEPLPGHPECDASYSTGDLVLKVDVKLNLLTGQGNAHGRVTIYPEAYQGTWVGSFQGKIRDFMMEGTSVVHGTGELEGLTMKTSIQEVGPGTYEVHGYVIEP